MSPHLNYYEAPSSIYKNCDFSNGDTNIWLTYSNCILLNKTEGSSVDASGVYANELQSILKVIICWTFIVLFHILNFFKNLKYRNYFGSSFDKTLKTNNIIIIPSNKKWRSSDSSKHYLTVFSSYEKSLQKLYC